MTRNVSPSARSLRTAISSHVTPARAHVIRTLARDSEIVVAGPVLQFSPLLADEDLLEIIHGAPIAGSLTAIARRVAVTGPVADAIGDSPDAAAITALLENPSAQ